MAYCSTFSILKYAGNFSGKMVKRKRKEQVEPRTFKAENDKYGI